MTMKGKGHFFLGTKAQIVPRPHFWGFPYHTHRHRHTHTHTR